MTFYDLMNEEVIAMLVQVPEKMEVGYEIDH